MVLLNDAFVQDKDGGNYAFLKEFARKYMTLLPFFAPINNTESENIITIPKEIVMDMDNIYEILKRQRRSNALIEAWHRVMKADLSAKAIEIGNTPLRIGRFMKYIFEKIDSKIMSCRYDLPEHMNSRNKEI
jgi:hypothetical protein